jgi:hypothetical protein
MPDTPLVVFPPELLAELDQELATAATYLAGLKSAARVGLATESRETIIVALIHGLTEAGIPPSAATLLAVAVVQLVEGEPQ